MKKPSFSVLPFANLYIIFCASNGDRQVFITIGDAREVLVRRMFDDCCDTGNVDGFVLSQLRHASKQLYRELVDGSSGLGGPNADTSVASVLRNIPSEWSANVVE
jgi:hypothetical protein